MLGSPAASYAVGQALPPYAPGEPPDYVAAIVADDRDGYLRLDTHDGHTWSFPFREAILFPRRDRYGTRRDFSSAARPPLLRELCIGDLLPNGVVAGVRPFVALTWELDIWEGNGEMYTYWFHREERVVCAGRECVARIGDRGGRDGMTRVHGPYLYTPTNCLLLLARHRFGRGRWPKGVVVPSELRPVRPGHIPVARPPADPAEWDDLDYRADLGPEISDLPTDFLFVPSPHPASPYVGRDRAEATP